MRMIKQPICHIAAGSLGSADFRTMREWCRICSLKVMNTNPISTAVCGAILIVATFACTTENNSMSTTAPAGQPEAARNTGDDLTHDLADADERGQDSGKGAPALGGEGERRNASVAAARGSAHSGVTDADHINALDRPDADQTKIPEVRKEARKTDRKRGH